jgi:hypothetical protein
MSLTELAKIAGLTPGGTVIGDVTPEHRSRTLEAMFIVPLRVIPGLGGIKTLFPDGEAAEMAALIPVVVQA